MAAGVEEPEAAALEGSGELTETQLKMVEEIVEQYIIAAHPAAKPRRKWPWALVCAVLILASYTLFQRLEQLDQRYQALQSDFWQVQETIGYEINGISDRVEEVLKAQNNLTADYGMELFRTNLRENRALFHAYAVPKTFQEGMTVRFSISDSRGGSNTVPGEPGLGGTYTATLAEQLTDHIEISVRFTYPDGTTQTQLLDTYEGLYSDSLPQVRLTDSFITQSFASGGGEQALALAGGTLVAMERPSDAGAVSVRVGAFLNQRLLAWAEPLPERPEDFGWYPNLDDRVDYYFSVPALSCPMEPGDRFCFAAVVTDEYDRTTVFPGSIQQVSRDGTEIRSGSSADNALYEDPAGWEFD